MKAQKFCSNRPVCRRGWADEGFSRQIVWNEARFLTILDDLWLLFFTKASLSLEVYSTHG
jgi:hypothetical protein